MKKYGFVIIALCFLLSACSGGSDNGYQKIDAQQAKQMMEDESVIILDVRTQEEYEEGHIPNAKLLPLDQIERISDIAKQDDTLLVYCRSGNRSAQAAQYLSQAGYENVFDFGGIISWPYDIER